MSSWVEGRVESVRHWTDRLFSFRVTRPQSLRFRSGEFVMIGLMGDNGKPLLRAYSIASPAWDEELEFYSIKVPDGPLTSKLQHIQPGDEIILRPKPVGTLVHDALMPVLAPVMQITLPARSGIDADTSGELTAVVIVGSPEKYGSERRGRAAAP